MSIYGSILYAVQDQVKPDAPSLWCSTCLLCAGSGYMRRCLSVTVTVYRYTYAPPRCRTSQYRRNFISLSVSLWSDLGDPVFDRVGLAGLKSKANAFLLA